MKYCDTSLEGVINELEGVVDELEGVVDELEGVVNELEGVVNELEGVVDELEGVVNELEWWLSSACFNVLPVIQTPPPPHSSTQKAINTPNLNQNHYQISY